MYHVLRSRMVNGLLDKGSYPVKNKTSYLQQDGNLTMAMLFRQVKPWFLSRRPPKTGSCWFSAWWNTQTLDTQHRFLFDKSPSTVGQTSEIVDCRINVVSKNNFGIQMIQPSQAFLLNSAPLRHQTTAKDIKWYEMICTYMAVSWNRATPKNHPFVGGISLCKPSSYGGTPMAWPKLYPRAIYPLPFSSRPQHVPAPSVP